MILDSEKDREMLLAAIKASAWPGEIVKEVATLLHKVERAQVAAPPERKP